MKRKMKKKNIIYNWSRIGTYYTNRNIWHLLLYGVAVFTNSIILWVWIYLIRLPMTIKRYLQLKIARTQIYFDYPDEYERNILEFIEEIATDR